MNSLKTMRGFTVLELMITVAVTAVILSIGVPSFLGIIETNRTVTHTNDVVSALNLGRSEAVRRGTPIIVCSSTDGANCSASNDWSTGWVIRTTSATPEVLRAWPARSGGAGVLSANVSQVQFQARGTLPPGAPPQLQLRLPNCGDAENHGRDVSVNSAGRINVVKVQCP